MTDIKTNTLRINASYSLKLPDETVPFASQDMSMSMSFDVDVPEGADIEQVIARAVEAQAAAATEVKLNVFAQMGVEPKTIADGVIAPNLEGYKGAEKAKSSGTRSGGASSGGRSGSYGSGGRPSSSGRQTARTPRGEIVTLVGNIGWKGAFAEGDYYDNRATKTNPAAADFAPVGGKDSGLPSLWIEARGGGYNEDVLDAMEAAGLDVSQY